MRLNGIGRRRKSLIVSRNGNIGKASAAQKFADGTSLRHAAAAPTARRSPSPDPHPARRLQHRANLRLLDEVLRPVSSPAPSSRHGCRRSRGFPEPPGDRPQGVGLDPESGEGGKDRVTMAPENLVLPLRDQLLRAKRLHDRDLEEGFGAVSLPTALTAKYASAPKSWGWQYVFPAAGAARSGAPRELGEARSSACASPFLRYPPAAGRLRHFEPCRSCSATRASAPRWSTPMC